MSKTKKILQLSGKFHKCGAKFLHFTHFWNFHHSYKKSVYWVAEWARCTCELSSASDKWQYYCAPTPLDFLLVEVGDADNDCPYHIIGAHNLSSSSAWSSLSSILKGCWDWQSTVYLYSGFGQNHPPPWYHRTLWRKCHVSTTRVSQCTNH